MLKTLDSIPNTTNKTKRKKKKKKGRRNSQCSVPVPTSADKLMFNRKGYKN
jgi:hypothetical protein